LRDVSNSQVEIIAARKSALIGEAQMHGVRTHHFQNLSAYGHLGKKASMAMKEIEARVDLYNLTPMKAALMTINNITYHLSGTGNRVVHGDDNSVNIINEGELFAQLASIIRTNVDDPSGRAEILEKLDELKCEKNKTDYLTKLTRFLSAAAAIAHFVAPYLPALTERASLLL
jgi:hypothetical protein